MTEKDALEIPGPTLADIGRMLEYRCRPGCDLCTDANTIHQYVLKMRIALESAEAVIASYRNAQIAAREFDEGDEEHEKAYREAWIAHVNHDPSLLPDPEECDRA